MNFYLRQAARELRRGRRKFVFFLLCIAIGVAGLVGIKGFNVSLQGALLREARPLMAADMQLSTSQPVTADQTKVFETLAGQGIRTAHNTETTSMAVHPDTKASTLVEVKAVDAGYPFYGVLELNPAGELTAETALVGPELLEKLGLKPGDSVKVGAATFRIAGVVTKEPDRVTASLSVGPRVMINRAGLDRAELIQPGSRAREVWLFKLANDAQVESTRATLKAAFPKARIADFREAQPQVKRFLDRMTAFLSLVSMVALLVGGLGVANATRVFIHQKLDAIAVMKVIGATNRRVVGVYLTQMLFLALAGSILGVLAGFAVQLVMPRVAGQIIPGLTVQISLSPEVAAQGIVVGLSTALLFTLLPLSSIFDVKPALVFRREMSEQRAKPTRAARTRQLVLLAAVGSGLAVIAGWLSGNLKWGLWFMAGLAGATLLLFGAAAVAVRLVKLINLPRRWVAARQGLANIHRPGSQASAIVLAIGVGVTMVLAVYLLQRGLMREVSAASPLGAPNVYFFPIQQKDVDAFRAFMKQQPGIESFPDPTPLVQGRLRAIDGKTKAQLGLTEEEERWFDFQFNFTYSEPLPAGNILLAGRWWTPRDWQGRTLVSVEQSSAQRLRLKVGSVVEMELQGGIPIKAEVFNIRQTRDLRAGGAFNFIFAPGALENVPVSYVAQARVRAGAAGPLQREAATRFPAVTIIDLNAVMGQVQEMIDRVGVVIRFVAGFSVVAGLIILASSIAATKFRRTRDAVLFKTLGASRTRVWRMFAVEYLALGLTAGVVGSGLAAVATWAVLKYVMEAPFQFELVPLLVGVVFTTLLTVIVGVASTLDVLSAKPLQVLREE